MQADMLIGFNKPQKMVGKNHFQLESTHKYSSDKGGISNIDIDGKSFFEFVSMLVKEESTDSLETEQVKQALKKLMDDGKSPTILAELLQFFDTMKSPAEHTDLKEDLEDLIQFFQKMSLSESKSLSKDEGEVSEFLKRSGKLPEGFSETSGNLIFGRESENEKQHSHNIDKQSQANIVKQSQANIVKQSQSDVVKQSQIVLDDQKLQSNTQNHAIVENLNILDGKDQKNNFEMKEITAKPNSNLKNFQSTETEKIKIGVQSESINQNDLESKKETSQLIDKMVKKKGTPDLNQLSNTSATSSQINKSISMAADEIEIGKSRLELKYADDRIVSINKEGDSKGAMDFNGKSENYNSKFETLIEESKFNNEEALKVKFNSDKMPSTVNEAKILPRTQQPNQIDIIKQIVEKVNLSSNKEHGKITIKLKPEILGNIRLNISNESHHVTIKVMADSSMVKDILESNLHHLKNGFVNQGLEIGSFDVMVSDEPESFFKEHNFSGFQRGRRRVAGQKKFSLDSSEEEETIDPVLPDHTKVTNDRIDYYV
jgi:flagellar hook-length control protein FliK